MSNEELGRAIESLREQEARYTTRLESDKLRVARLEEAYASLADLAATSNNNQ